MNSTLPRSRRRSRRTWFAVGAVLLLIVGIFAVIQVATSGSDCEVADRSSTDAPSAALVESTPPRSATEGADGAGDDYFPTYGNGGYDVLSYDLMIDWDDVERTIDATADITLVATQTLSQFNVDLVGLDVSSVDVDGAAARFERQGRELTISPAAPLALDATAVVSIAYSGTPAQVPSPGSPIAFGWTDLGDTIFVAGEPEGSEGWYPVNAHPTDKATYRIAVTADEALVVAANGTQVSVTADAGKKTWVYESVNPQAYYLTTLAIGDFARHDGAPSQSGVPVRHYFDTQVFDDAVVSMERTGEMIDVFEARFGPYPFENYGSVVVDCDLGFALETQTLAVFGRDFVDRDGTYDNIVAHEIAHQWFGNHVSLGQWSDLWLNEGFASYGEYLWLEASRPDLDLDQIVRRDFEEIKDLLNSPPGAPPPEDIFTTSVYLRGGFTLHALRITIGDDAFFQLLATYAEEFGGSHAVTSDFTSLAEDISGQDLAEFFQAWLFDPQVPPLPN